MMEPDGRVRGHDAYLDPVGTLRYCDDGTPVPEPDVRPCASCGLVPTPEGYDGCLGFVPGAAAACCGHGRSEDAYVVTPEELAAGASPD